MERDIVIRLDITADEMDCFALLSEPELQAVHQIIWRLACQAAAYMLAARGDVASAALMARSARTELP